MSAGAFVRARYGASYALEVHPIRVQPETLAATIGGTVNAAPAGAITNPISARASGSKRSLGLNARKVQLAAPATNPPAGYQAGGVTSIPALGEAFYNLAIKGTTCTYLGAAFTVVSRTTEYVN